MLRQDTAGIRGDQDPLDAIIKLYPVYMQLREENHEKANWINFTEI